MLVEMNGNELGLKISYEVFGAVPLQQSSLKSSFPVGWPSSMNSIITNLDYISRLFLRLLSVSLFDL